MTNGEKLKETFPNFRITFLESCVQVMGENYEFCNAYTLKWWNAEYTEPSNSEKPNNPIRYIVLQVQKNCKFSSNSHTICHGIFNDFYKAVGKCVCLIGDSDDDWLKSAYKITDRSDMWRTETENGFGWYRKYVHENPEIVVEETWLVIDGDVEL